MLDIVHCRSCHVQNCNLCSYSIYSELRMYYNAISHCTITIYHRYYGEQTRSHSHRAVSTGIGKTFLRCSRRRGEFIILLATLAQHITDSTSSQGKCLSFVLAARLSQGQHLPPLLVPLLPTHLAIQSHPRIPRTREPKYHNQSRAKY